MQPKEEPLKKLGTISLRRRQPSRPGEEEVLGTTVGQRWGAQETRDLRSYIHQTAGQVQGNRRGKGQQRGKKLNGYLSKPPSKGRKQTHPGQRIYCKEKQVWLQHCAAGEQVLGVPRPLGSILSKGAGRYTLQRKGIPQSLLSTGG